MIKLTDFIATLDQDKAIFDVLEDSRRTWGWQGYYNEDELLALFDHKNVIEWWVDVEWVDRDGIKGDHLVISLVLAN